MQLTILNILVITDTNSYPITNLDKIPKKCLVIPVMTDKGHRNRWHKISSSFFSFIPETDLKASSSVYLRIYLWILFRSYFMLTKMHIESFWTQNIMVVVKKPIVYACLLEGKLYSKSRSLINKDFALLKNHIPSMNPLYA